MGNAYRKLDSEDSIHVLGESSEHFEIDSDDYKNLKVYDEFINFIHEIVLSVKLIEGIEYLLVCYAKEKKTSLVYYFDDCLTKSAREYTINKFAAILEETGIGLKNTANKSYQLNLKGTSINLNQIKTILKPFMHGLSKTQIHQFLMATDVVFFYSILNLRREEFPNIIFKLNKNTPFSFVKPVADKLEEMFNVDINHAYEGQNSRLVWVEQKK